MKVYGITNCDTVKKALTWLKDHQVEFEFHNFKKEGISPEKLKEWNQKFLNKQGLTWKQLDPEVKESVKTADDALNLLQQKTSMIKRPVIEDGGFLYFGFNEKDYSNHFNI
jgi:Spx/MgsR family transcriptional regulator